MYRQIFLALMVCLGLLTAQNPVNAQKRPRPRPKTGQPQKQSTPTKKSEPVDPHAEQRKKLAEAVEKACEKLQQTIIDANATGAIKPFESLTPYDQFQGGCTRDGTLVWRAVRQGESDDNASGTQYGVWVTVKVTDLELGDLRSSGSTVNFRTKNKDIYLYGKRTDAGKVKSLDEYVDAWYIKLREVKYATAFMGTTRTLVASLNAREKLPPVA